MFPKSRDDQTLEDIIRSMFGQGQTSSPKDQSNWTSEDETNLSQAVKDACRMARMAMHMAIGALNSADEKQDQVEEMLRRRLAAEKKEIKKLQRRLDEELQWQDEAEKMSQTIKKMKREEKEWKQERLREELEREKQWRQGYMEREAAEQEAVEELKQAREEVKKARKEAARARQEADLARERAERAEEAQRKQSAQNDSTQRSKEQVYETAAWARYIEQWELFKRFSLVAGADARGGVFRFEDIPWPTVTPPTSPSKITKKEVESFLFSSYSGQSTSLRTRIRECLLIWHPDKFSGRWMRFIIETDRARVIEGVSAVTRAGNDLLVDYANRRRTT
ncbi:hypothetical protein BDV93DRAFT_604114 [Ceratobasidium sp. AG-I]|nr:hypothetical protein BDV93DRAFT_604114 [Ceratobasidium sp. AG-I]